MGKVKRKKKEKKVIDTTPRKLCVGEINCQEGCTVIIKRLPEDIKKAKKKFEVGKEYVIQKAPAKRRNSLGSVYLKGDDGEVYQVQFPYYRLTGRLEDGSVVKGTYINQPTTDKKKKKKKRK